MNRKIMYEEVKTYKLLQPKHILTIHTHKGELFLVADNNIDRVIAILDQHDIQGDLARDDYVNLITNVRKFVLMVITFTMVVFFLKKLGLFAR